jgi:preprotein translocase subunit SecY
MALQNTNNSNTQLLKAKINNLHQILSLFMAIFRGLVVTYGLRYLYNLIKDIKKAGLTGFFYVFNI